MNVEVLSAVARLDEQGFIVLKEGQCLADVARIIELSIDVWELSD